jgi:hypothetical protein
LQLQQRAVLLQLGNWISFSLSQQLTNQAWWPGLQKLKVENLFGYYLD